VETGKPTNKPDANESVDY